VELWGARAQIKPNTGSQYLAIGLNMGGMLELVHARMDLVQDGHVT
jgi:hypothetical protein